jgi:ATP-dependent RNA helicase DDX10/DBP4
LASDIELKESAQRAFQSYLKSIFLLKNKSVFDVFKLDTTAFAASLGLAVPPRVRFLQKQLKLKEEAKQKNLAKNSATENSLVEGDENGEEKKPKKNVLTCDSDGKKCSILPYSGG